MSINSKEAIKYKLNEFKGGLWNKQALQSPPPLHESFCNFLKLLDEVTPQAQELGLRVIVGSYDLDGVVAKFPFASFATPFKMFIKGGSWKPSTPKRVDGIRDYHYPETLGEKFSSVTSNAMHRYRAANGEARTSLMDMRIESRRENVLLLPIAVSGRELDLYPMTKHWLWKRGFNAFFCGVFLNPGERSASWKIYNLGEISKRVAAFHVEDDFNTIEQIKASKLANPDGSDLTVYALESPLNHLARLRTGRNFSSPVVPVTTHAEITNHFVKGVRIKKD